MKQFLRVLSLLALPIIASAQPAKTTLQHDAAGYRLLVDGKPFMMNGMNWDYFPAGTNYNYSLWKQSDDFIRRALDYEMTLLKNMGVNTIRQYYGVPAKWIQYIYEKHGIYTVLNHSYGRYGLNVDGTWMANTDYSNPRVQEILISEVVKMVEETQNTPGVLLYLLGNENNYGLFWEGAETEDIPMEDRKSTKKAIHLYKAFNQGALAMKSKNKDLLVSLCNGDLLFLDLIVEEAKDVDILGINIYRGYSFTGAYDEVKRKLNKPVFFAEFGSDAFNAITHKEDQEAQAGFLLSNWKEIYEHAYGMGKTGLSLGGMTFQFSDGWWKYGQTLNLDVHDTNASWANGGYSFDYVKGENNMNEEWFGVCAKGKTDEQGFYQLYPRTGYFILQQIHQFDPYKSGSKNEIDHFFGNISLIEATQKAKAERAIAQSENANTIRLSRLTADFSTFHTGGKLITTPATPVANSTSYPNRLGFDHLQSFYVGVEVNPTSTVSANVEFNVLGHVPTNPIDEVFYENRGRDVVVETTDGPLTLRSNDRIQLYRSKFNWKQKYFDLTGFYRTGHYHWGYEGDFFGLYPEANYGPNIDLYNGEAPAGFEVEGHKFLKGLKMAYGPELWWGANPAVLLKYSKTLKKATWTGIFHEDLGESGNINSSFAIPQPKTRRLTLHMNRAFDKLKVDLGGIWAGKPLEGRTFQLVRDVNGQTKVFQDKIKPDDMWGGKLKLMYQSGKIGWYGQGAVMGLVANGGADYTKTFTGWTLKDSGSGNQYNVLSGLIYNIGHVQIAPNFLWQKPIEGPITKGVPAPGRPRNILDDPFVVRANREQMAGEILITYDPTPATWMYEWDNDNAEDAALALSAGFVYRHLPTSQDAAIGIQQDGRSVYAFDGAAPAKDLWEARARIVSRPVPHFGLIANLYGGTAQANGSDPRTVNRAGIDLRMIYKKMKLNYFFKLNDWGPFDYHRDFNLTYPMQQMLDVSTELGRLNFIMLPATKVGIRGTYRTLDQYSPRYSPVLVIDPDGNFIPNPNAIGFSNGKEWEIRTYIQFNL